MSDRENGAADYTVLIPAYNEAEGLPAVLPAVLKAAPGAEIIVIDDGSTDGTGEVAQRAAAEDAIRVIRHKKNRGYGAALKSGIQAAAHELIVIADADGSYPLERITDLVAMARDADMVVGARVGAKAAIPMVRRPAKWVLNQLANYMSRTKIPDLNSGMRVMRKSVVKRFIRILPDGFSFTTTITMAMLVDGYEVVFEPIEYHPRKGRSKIRPIRDTANFTQLILRTILFFAPMRVFGPVSLALFALSAAVLIVGKLAFGAILDGTIVALFVSGLQVGALGLVADLVNRKIER